MRQLNTIPIEDMLDKIRIAIKSNQKSLTLSIKEATDLQNSLAIVMTRLAGEMDQLLIAAQQPETVEIKMNGGKFQSSWINIANFGDLAMYARFKLPSIHTAYHAIKSIA